MDRAKASAIARDNGWLSMTPVDFQDAALARCELLEFAAGASIFNAGDDTGGLYGVIEGTVGLYLHSLDGQLGLGHIGRPGFWTGDLSALTGRPRRIAVSARSCCWMLRLPRPGLISFAEDQPFAWRHVASLIASNLQLTLDIIDALKRTDPLERMAATILNLMAGEAGASFALEISHTELGAITNMSRGSVSTFTAQLQDRGWVRRGYGNLTVTDREAMARFVRGE